MLRFLTDDGPRLGLAGDGYVIELNDGAGVPVTRARAFIALSEEERRGLVKHSRGQKLRLDGLTLVAPIDDPGKIVAIGMNYPDHALEGGNKIPDDPLVFAKFPSSIIGPGHAIVARSSVTTCVDYEAELAVVIGRTARQVEPGRALSHVYGYTCLNDVSARDLQFRDGQWVRAKSLDSFCPIGPWIVTADEIPDPQTLPISCVVSGELRQSASTSEMFFSVAELISRLSGWFTLYPGDVIATGTPPGVGYFQKPQALLQDGDTVTVEIGGIGVLSNPVVLTDG